mgnify:CR=1 FL=1
MQNNKLMFSFSVILLVLLIMGCSQPDPTKAPITTNSKKALEFYLQARDLSEKLRGQESIALYQKAIQFDPDFAVAYLNLAFVMPTFKEFFEKLNQAKALVENVSEAERHWILGVDAGVNGYQMIQRDHYTKLVELYPEDERAHNLLGNHYFGQQDYNNAITQYKLALDIAPDFSQPYNQLGYALRFQGNFGEAEKVFQKYIELIPDDPNPYDSYAELLLRMGKYEESIASYRKALEIDQHFVASHVGIATNLNYSGRYEAAIKQLHVLLEGARNIGESRTAYFAMAVSYLSGGEIEKALDMQTEQLELSSEANDEAAMTADMTVAGNILAESGRSEIAIKMYEEAWKTIESASLEKDVQENNYRNLLYNSTKARINLGELEVAALQAEEYRALVEAIQNPFQIRLANELDGIIAYERGQYGLALDMFQTSNQQNPYILYRTAQAFAGLGQQDSALAYAEEAVSFNALNSMNQVFIRNPAQDLIESLK